MGWDNMVSIKKEIDKLWSKGKTIAQIEKELNVKIDTRRVSLRDMHGSGSTAWIRKLRVKKKPKKRRK
jgi:hypothetical protein